MVVGTRVKSGPLDAVALMRPPGVMPRRASTDVWLIKVTEEGPLGLRAARVLLGGVHRSDRRRGDDRDRSLLAHAALVRLLATRADMDVASVVIDHEEGGRPIVAGNPGLMLAVGHSGEFVACAVSTRPVGVDIERSDRSSCRRSWTVHTRRASPRTPAARAVAGTAAPRCADSPVDAQGGGRQGARRRPCHRARTSRREARPPRRGRSGRRSPTRVRPRRRAGRLCRRGCDGDPPGARAGTSHRRRRGVADPRPGDALASTDGSPVGWLSW
jgi:hypothetical protein